MHLQLLVGPKDRLPDQLEISDDDIPDRCQRSILSSVNKDRDRRIVAKRLPIGRLCIFYFSAGKFRESLGPLLWRFEIVKQ